MDAEFVAASRLFINIEKNFLTFNKILNNMIIMLVYIVLKMNEYEIKKCILHIPQPNESQ